MLLYIIRYLIKRLEFLLSDLFTLKKLTFLVLLILLKLRKKTLPIRINSSEFLKLFKENSTQISFMKVFISKFIIFKLKGRSYFTNYSPFNTDNFSKELISDIFESILSNPYLQFSILFIGSGFVLSQSIMETYLNFKRNSKREIKDCITNDEYLNNFIAKGEIKKKLCFFIDQLRYPEKFRIKGLKTARGLLLYGPPGTGKTLIARCLAKINKINFLPKCASEFVEIYVGSGAKSIRDTFKEAKKLAPAIIFIDELEAIGFKRSSNSKEYSSNAERYSALNQLLNEMDGLENNNDIIVVGATNKYELLDDALIRPGRFSYKIAIELPEKEERKGIFRHYFKIYGMELFNEIDLEEFAKETKFFSGAEIEGVVSQVVSLSISESNGEINKKKVIDIIKADFKNMLNYQLNQLNDII